MLARTELTAEQLGIPEEFRQALIAVRGKLERGELSQDKGTPIDKRFDMHRACHCIIGHARKELPGYQMFPLWTDGLARLYAHFGPASPTVEQAAQATSNYLSTGQPRWSEVMAG